MTFHVTFLLIFVSESLYCSISLLLYKYSVYHNEPFSLDIFSNVNNRNVFGVFLGRGGYEYVLEPLW